MVLPELLKTDVWAQIEADCVDAAAKCRAKAAEEPGRATSGAAWALLGKARLYQKNYQGALEAFNNITGYSLEPVYFRQLHGRNRKWSGIALRSPV